MKLCVEVEINYCLSKIYVVRIADLPVHFVSVFSAVLLLVGSVVCKNSFPTIPKSYGFT